MVVLAATSAPLGGQATQITDAERDGLIFMREEEKLARDVYLVLAKKWGDRPFGNIASSEQTHMDAVKGLLDKYGLPDPAKGMEKGKFESKPIQKLYDDLVAKGERSRMDALKVGAQIEDLDIFDLERWTRTVKAADIKNVYANLTRGSRNHLRSFTGALKRSGGEYEPMYLSKKDFEAIINSPMERGRGGL